MDRHTIQNDLAGLYNELANIKEMTNAQVCKTYQVNYKREAIALIQDEISSFESELEETTFDYTEEELEDERQAICRVQGLNRYC